MSEVCVTGSVQEQNKTDTRGSDLREFGAVGKGLTSESMEYSEEGGIKPVALCGNKHHCSNRVPRMSEEGL